jgi:hypothetical protein
LTERRLDVRSVRLLRTTVLRERVRHVRDRLSPSVAACCIAFDFVGRSTSVSWPPCSLAAVQRGTKSRAPCGRITPPAHPKSRLDTAAQDVSCGVYMRVAVQQRRTRPARQVRAPKSLQACTANASWTASISQDPSKNGMARPDTRRPPAPSDSLAWSCHTSRQMWQRRIGETALRQRQLSGEGRLATRSSRPPLPIPRHKAATRSPGASRSLKLVQSPQVMVGIPV